ncbi:MAG: phosphorylase family protein [Gemmobacter sp.]
MAVLDFKADRWREALDIGQDEVPDALILEGTWWWRQAKERRLSHLTGVQEAAFPDIYFGRFGDARVAYCCAYGAARAAEPAHVFAQLGTPLIVQIGTCGAVTPAFRAGSVAVPGSALAREGVSQTYLEGDAFALDAGWSDQARGALVARGIPAMDSRHLTWTTLFAQSDALCADWAREGVETVDMETATVAAVAARFGVAALSMLAVWDLLADGKTFLDPMTPMAETALAAANDATWSVALEMATLVAQRRQETTNA